MNEPNELLGYHVGLQQTVGANEQMSNWPWSVMKYTHNRFQ